MRSLLPATPRLRTLSTKRIHTNRIRRDASRTLSWTTSCWKNRGLASWNYLGIAIEMCGGHFWEYSRAVVGKPRAGHQTGPRDLQDVGWLELQDHRKCYVMGLGLPFLEVFLTYFSSDGVAVGCEPFETSLLI